RLRGVYPQAVAQFKEALELLRKLPGDYRTLEEELATQLALASTLLSKLDLAALPEYGTSLLRARDLTSQLSNYDALVRSLDGLRFFYRFRGRSKNRVCSVKRRSRPRRVTVLKPLLLLRTWALRTPFYLWVSSNKLDTTLSERKAQRLPSRPGWTQ